MLDISEGGVCTDLPVGGLLADDVAVEIEIVRSGAMPVYRTATVANPVGSGACRLSFTTPLEPAELSSFLASRERDASGEFEIEQLVDHARLMWQAEVDNNRRLSLRGRVIVGSTTGLLGFVAIGLLVAGSDSRLNLVLDETKQGPLLVASFVSTASIGVGLLLCIWSVAINVMHREEDSGLLGVRTEFGRINTHYFATQPNLWSVSSSYLIASFLRHDKGVLFRPVYQAYAFCRGWWLGLRGRVRFGTKDKISRGWSRRRASIYSVASMLVWAPAQVLFLLVPGVRNSVFLRRAIDAQYRRMVYQRVSADVRRANWLESFLRRADSGTNRLAYITEESRQPNPRHPRIMATSSSYFLQFAEGFISKWVGVGVPTDDPLDREDPKVPYSEHDRLSACDTAPPFSEPLWRVFVSTYFSAQQLRSANWNLWFRVRRAERFFTTGLVVVALSFIATAGIGEVIRKEAAPSVPLLIDMSGDDGRLEVRPDLRSDQTRTRPTE